MTIALAVTATVSGAYATRAQAQSASGDFPSRPVRMIIPLGTGGGSDIVGRILAVALSEAWGQSVIVDNRPGAGTVVGTSIAAKAPADGYTLMVSSSSMAITPALRKNLPFDIVRDFAPVSMLASQPSMLAVHASVPAKNVKDLIALAKSEPGKLAFGSAGPGSATHLGSELFQSVAGIKMVHVPYKSAGLATNALLGGEVQVLLTNMASILPHVSGGKVRALGVTSLKRSSLAQDIPTVSESGLPKFEYLTWYGLVVPAGTPRARVDQIQRDSARMLQSPKYLPRFTQQGLDVFTTTPPEFARFLKTEMARWDMVVSEAGIKLD